MLQEDREKRDVTRKTVRQLKYKLDKTRENGDTDLARRNGVRQVFSKEVDLEPNTKNNQLNVIRYIQKCI